MKTILAITFLVSTITTAYSQTEHKRVYKYGKCQENWAKVKSITGNFGMIDQNGKEVVPAVYVKIGKFVRNNGQLARVKSITGNYGMINRKGEEVIPTVYLKIGRFGEFESDLALVKTVAGYYGFINKNGTEVVEPIYSLKQIKSNDYTLARK